MKLNRLSVSDYAQPSLLKAGWQDTAQLHNKTSLTARLTVPILVITLVHYFVQVFPAHGAIGGFISVAFCGVMWALSQKWTNAARILFVMVLPLYFLFLSLLISPEEKTELLITKLLMLSLVSAPITLFRNSEMGKIMFSIAYTLFAAWLFHYISSHNRWQLPIDASLSAHSLHIYACVIICAILGVTIWHNSQFDKKHKVDFDQWIDRAGQDERFFENQTSADILTESRTANDAASTDGFKDY